MTPTPTPIKPDVGAEFAGMSPDDLLDEDAAQACLDALERYGVLVYRELHIGDAELVAFSRLLGEVVPNRTNEHELPEIATITLDPAHTNPVLAWYRKGNFLWHIDGATDELPQRATLLTARRVDDAGGDTEFANTYSAYEALSADRQAEIDDLRVVHSFTAAQRKAHPDATDEQLNQWSGIPTREHPLVWTRRDGRRSLLLGATADVVVGMPEDDGRALLDELLDWATQPRFSLRHTWREGDLVVWDNTGMLHRAMPYEPTSPRLMHRTTLVGVEPVA